MSQDQPWALSQKAKKKNGTCSVCLKVRQLKEKDGTVHLHGHTGDRCGGSNKLPLSVDALRSYQTPVNGSNATYLPVYLTVYITVYLTVCPTICLTQCATAYVIT